MNRRHRIPALIFSLLVAALLCLPPLTVYGADDGEGVSYRVNAERTMIAIPLDASAATGAKDIIDQLQRSRNLPSVTLFVSTVSGAAPELIIAGDNEYDVEKVFQMFRMMFAETAKQKHLVVISASLKELTDRDLRSIGINLVPTVNARGYYDFGRDRFNPSRDYDQTVGTIEAQLSDALKLSDTKDKSKILVSSEVYTPNGLKGQVSSVQRLPVFSTDRNGNVQTEFTDLETSISVTPTILQYNRDKPEDSSVKLDVAVKVSVISGSKRMGNVSAPEYTVKNMNTTRVFKANGQSGIVGTFVTDGNIHGRSGVPILSEIPLLKYLFSQETTEKVRNIAILTLAVRILPAETQ